LVWNSLSQAWKDVYNKLHNYVENELLKKHGME